MQTFACLDLDNFYILPPNYQYDPSSWLLKSELNQILVITWWNQIVL